MEDWKGKGAQREYVGPSDSISRFGENRSGHSSLSLENSTALASHAEFLVERIMAKYKLWTDGKIYQQLEERELVPWWQKSLGLPAAMQQRPQLGMKEHNLGWNMRLEVAGMQAKNELQKLEAKRAELRAKNKNLREYHAEQLETTRGRSKPSHCSGKSASSEPKWSSWSEDSSPKATASDWNVTAEMATISETSNRRRPTSTTKSNKDHVAEFQKWKDTVSKRFTDWETSKQRRSLDVLEDEAEMKYCPARAVEHAWKEMFHLETTREATGSYPRPEPQDEEQSWDTLAQHRQFPSRKVEPDWRPVPRTPEESLEDSPDLSPEYCFEKNLSGTSFDDSFDSFYRSTSPQSTRFLARSLAESDDSETERVLASSNTAGERHHCSPVEWTDSSLSPDSAILSSSPLVLNGQECVSSPLNIPPLSGTVCANSDGDRLLASEEQFFISMPVRATAQSARESKHQAIWRLRQRVLEESSDDEEGDRCRICHNGDTSPNNPLLTPCKCSGSLRFIHRDCLKMWIQARVASGLQRFDLRRCELCQVTLDMDLETLEVQTSDWERLF